MIMCMCKGPVQVSNIRSKIQASSFIGFRKISFHLIFFLWLGLLFILTSAIRRVIIVLIHVGTSVF